MFGRRALLALTALILCLPAPAQLTFHRRRNSPTDLEVTGLVHGIPPGKSRFISQQALATLPQIHVTTSSASDYLTTPRSAFHVTGLYMDNLARALGALPSANAIIATCSDGYTSTFSSDYLHNHRPIFALTIDGLDVADWSVQHHQQEDSSPYLILYRSFTPAFRVLAYEDLPEEPAGIVKLRFVTGQEVFAAITPRNISPASQTPPAQGFRIAQQNCFRCHNAGQYGGTKAHRTWQHLASVAHNRPDYFKRWIQNPQSLDPRATMPPFPQYDQPTLNALQRYFEAFYLPD